MKRKIFYATCFVLMVFSFHSCDLLNDCKYCRQNTYNSSDDLLSEGSETEYCDAALLRVEATKDVTVLGVTTKWVCR